MWPWRLCPVVYRGDRKFDSEEAPELFSGRVVREARWQQFHGVKPCELGVSLTLVVQRGGTRLVRTKECDIDLIVREFVSRELEIVGHLAPLIAPAFRFEFDDQCASPNTAREVGAPVRIGNVLAPNGWNRKGVLTYEPRDFVFGD